MCFQWASNHHLQVAGQGWLQCWCKFLFGPSLVGNILSLFIAAFGQDVDDDNFIYTFGPDGCFNVQSILLSIRVVCFDWPVCTWGCSVITLQAGLVQNFISSRHFDRSWAKYHEHSHMWTFFFLNFRHSESFTMMCYRCGLLFI